MLKLLRPSAVFALVVFAPLACGGDDEGGTGPETPVATSLEITPATATLTAIGDTRPLAATVRDQNGDAMAGATLSWSSLDTGVATVDAEGVATAVTAGTARITATSGSAADTAVITVAPAAASIAIQPPFGELHALGDSVRLEAVVRDGNGNALDSVAVAWTSVDTAVATVSDEGWVVAVAGGTARIRAAADELSDEAAVVIDQVPASIALTVPDDTLAEGESVQIEAVVADSNDAAIPDVVVAWTTSDTTAAVVDAGGRVTGVWGAATATLTATVGGVSAEADVLVLGKIAFRSDRTGGGDIYLMNTDGSGVERLTGSGSLDSGPVWSPDGRRIAFESLRDGNWEIYVMNADGSLLENVTNGPGDTIDVAPEWSPDGTRILFSSSRDTNWDLYVMNPDGTGLVRLTTDASAEDDPTWSPDGTRIAFISNRDGNEDIYVMNADGTGTPVQLTDTANPIQHTDLAWSPDGTRIAFTRSSDTDGGIWVMDADGSSPADLTPDTNLDGVPRWTPDGSRIVFFSVRDGNPEVYVMDADGSNQLRLTNGFTVDAEADWRPRPVN